MEARELSIIIISVLTIIIGFLSMLYFENKLDQIGTYESINLLYMLLSQALCGVGLIGLIIGLVLKNQPLNLNDRVGNLLPSSRSVRIKQNWLFGHT